MKQDHVTKAARGGKARTSRLPATPLTRRAFLQAGAVGAAGLVGSAAPTQAILGGASASKSGGRPNIVFISADQLGREALSACGCPDLSTPNIDRLFQRGLSFRKCYTADPLCSPARSSWFTGRMPSETGVVQNDLRIRGGMPTMGDVIRSGGYETYYAGKWHLPEPYTDDIPGFHVLPAGIPTEGNIADTAVSQACQGFLLNRRSRDPFLLVASFQQPHDICDWVADKRRFPLKQLPPGLSEAQLPELPPNFHFDRREPRNEVDKRPSWTPLQWRYYLWGYYRHVEMVDAEIGRVLDALENTPFANNTLIIFASDHGEGRARHKTVMKNFFYDEAVAVPLVCTWPGRIAQGAIDDAHLISSTDFLPTMCDYAGVPTPAGVVGRSLRPLLEGGSPTWRDMVASEVKIRGRMVRTADYKFITYRHDPVEQLFDMKNDPWETRNLAGAARFAAVMADHRKLLDAWESRLDKAPLRNRKKQEIKVDSE